MGRGWRWATALEERLASVLGAAGLLSCSDGTHGKVVRDCYALRSLPMPGVVDDAVAALSGRQPAHSDSPEPPRGELRQIAADDFPSP